MQLSHSQITTFLDCPEKYRLLRVEHLPEKPAWYLVGGKAVHEATEVLDGEHWDAPADSDEAGRVWRETFAAAIESAHEEDTTGTPEAEWRTSRKKGREWWEANGERMVRNWVRMRNERGLRLLDYSSDTGIELYVQAVFGRHHMRGYIDRVMVTPDGEVVVIDLKTGQAPKSMLQLGLYLLLLEEDWGVPASFAEYAVLEKSQWAGRIERKASREQIGRYVDWVASAVEAGRYVPNPGMFCSSCAVRDHCSIKDLLPEPAAARPDKPALKPVGNRPALKLVGNKEKE